MIPGYQNLSQLGVSLICVILEWSEFGSTWGYHNLGLLGWSQFGSTWVDPLLGQIGRYKFWSTYGAIEFRSTCGDPKTIKKILNIMLWSENMAYNWHWFKI